MHLDEPDNEVAASAKSAVRAREEKAAQEENAARKERRLIFFPEPLPFVFHPRLLMSLIHSRSPLLNAGLSIALTEPPPPPSTSILVRVNVFLTMKKCRDGETRINGAINK